MALSKEAILQAQDEKFEEVPVPEWGGSVRVRTLSGAERDGFEASCIQGRGENTRTNLANIRAKLCARCIVDDDGNRLFTDEEAEALGAKSASALDRVYTVAQRLNGLSKQDVKELAGN